MADLLDIAPATAVESVKLSDGQRVKVHRLHVNEIATLVQRFPSAVVMLTTGQDVLMQFLSGDGEAAAAVIAAGGGHIGDDKAEQIAKGLMAEDQLKLLKAIFWLTFPNGIGALVEAIGNLANGPGSDKPVKVRLKTSPSASPSSSAPDFPRTMQ
jgi:hypothetical protein